MTNKRTVLIAEDDEQFRLLLERFLTPDYTVISAEDGEAALKLATENRPDVVLTDVLMPRMTGVDLLREMKKRPETRDIPVIILLATATVADIKAAQSLHADGILPKEDISRQAVVEALRQRLGE